MGTHLRHRALERVAAVLPLRGAAGGGGMVSSAGCGARVGGLRRRERLCIGVACGRQSPPPALARGAHGHFPPPSVRLRAHDRAGPSSLVHSGAGPRRRDDGAGAERRGFLRRVRAGACGRHSRVRGQVAAAVPRPAGAGGGRRRRAARRRLQQVRAQRTHRRVVQWKCGFGHAPPARSRFLRQARRLHVAPAVRAGCRGRDARARSLHGVRGAPKGGGASFVRPCGVHIRGRLRLSGRHRMPQARLDAERRNLRRALRGGVPRRLGGGGHECPGLRRVPPCNRGRHVQRPDHGVWHAGVDGRDGQPRARLARRRTFRPALGRMRRLLRRMR